MRISNRTKNISSGSTDSCIYEIKNISSGKRYIGYARNARSRFSNHFFALRKGNHKIGDMQNDFDAGEEFEINCICKLESKAFYRGDRALESLFILRYNCVENGYNKSYNYPTKENARQAIQIYADYIIDCLRKNDISFGIEI